MKKTTFRFKPYCPDQLLLLPPDMKQWLPEGDQVGPSQPSVGEGTGHSATKVGDDSSRIFRDVRPVYTKYRLSGDTMGLSPGHAMIRFGSASFATIEIE